MTIPIHPLSKRELYEVMRDDSQPGQKRIMAKKKIEEI